MSESNTGLTLQERQASKQRNREAFLNAKKEKATRTFELRKTISLKEEELKKAKKETLNSSLSKEEIKEKVSAINKNIKDLHSYYKKQRKNIKSECKYKAFHRPFINAVDAFFSAPPMWIVNTIFVLIFVGIFIYFGIESEFFNASKGGTSNLILFLRGLFVPNYDLFFGTGQFSFESSVLYLCLQTFGIAFVGTLFSSILSIPFGFFASKKLFGHWSYISMTILIIIRTVPEILFCYILISVTGFGAITGVVVLSIQSIGMIGKMYSDNLDSIDMTFLEGLDSTGCSKVSRVFIGVFPQVFPNFISTILYRFDLNLRTASILGLVGAGDLGRLILTYSRNGNWPELGSLIWGLLVLILIIDFISTSIRKRLV